MIRKFLLLFICIFICCTTISAQKSDLHKRAETEDAKNSVAAARSLYIHAFNDYFNKGQIRPGAECAARATALYYRDGFWQEAFDLLRRLDQATDAASEPNNSVKAACHYLASKERMQMYIKMKRSEPAKGHLNVMESHARLANDEEINNDLLYSKAIFYYTFGETSKGNAVFKEMADKLTASKQYDKVDDVYKTLIANGRKSNNASLVAQSYNSYIAWKDSANAMKHADEINALKKQIADNEASMAEMDSSLTTRQAIIIGLCVLAAALAAALVIGGIVLLRFIVTNRKQKKAIQLANENNALKAKFIGNISAQLEPTFQKLDKNKPEVKALLEFSSHIQTLSELENSEEPVELEETQIPQFCEELMDQIRNKVKSEVTLTVNAPKMSAKINREYVSHILLHLLNNAAEYTPEEGTITLDFKKRSQHTHQFIISDTGAGIPEEQRDNIFKPFLEIRDLTKGDGLGLPICKQMAQRMNGDLEIDPSFTRGTRFVLELHV